jgi:hypothetical protein
MRKIKHINLNYICLILSLISFDCLCQNIEIQHNHNYLDLKYIQDKIIENKFENIEFQKEKIIIISEISDEKGIFLYLKNNSKDTLKIVRQELTLDLIQEAKDENGEWKAIEYVSYSWCGNSYYQVKVKPSEIIKVNCKKYIGNFNTEIRFKLLQNEKEYYSNIIKGNINISQFNIPENLILNLEQGSFNVVKMASRETAIKILTLDSTGKKEFNEKINKYIEQLKKKNSENKR